MTESEFLYVMGQNIAYYRKLRHFTQMELADMLHMKQVSLAMIETGRAGTTVKTLKRVADSLNIDSYKLLVMPKRKGKL